MVPEDIEKLVELADKIRDEKAYGITDMEMIIHVRDVCNEICEDFYKDLGRKYLSL